MRPTIRIEPMPPPAGLRAEDEVYFAPHRSDDGRFFLPWAETPGSQKGDLMGSGASRGLFSGSRRPRPAVLPSVSEPMTAFGSLPKGTRVMWLGHASLLIEARGLRVLVDPVFGDIGRRIRRAVPPPLPADDLPCIDVVLYTHGHADHLDLRSLESVVHRNDEVSVVVPLGLASAIAGVTQNVIEVDWWQRLRFGRLTTTFVPAHHNHKRGSLDTNRALWGGWIVAGERTVYHAGDTGWFDGFEAIGRIAGRIDLAVLPIGAYAPRGDMGDVHMSPDESLRAFRDVGARDFMGMHFGTFDLTDESMDAGVEALPGLIGAAGIDPDRVHVLAHGGAIGWSATELIRVGGFHAEAAGLSAAARADLGAATELTAGSASMGTLIRRRVELHPDRLAMRFLGDGRIDGPAETWRYEALAARAGAVAARLIGLGIAGDNILIAAEQASDRVLGLLACWIAGAVAVPVPSFLGVVDAPARFRALALDAGAAAALAPAKGIDEVVSVLRDDARLGDLPCLAVDGPIDGQTEQVAPHEVAGRDRNAPAVILYATGPRDRPRGVVVTHGNLIHNALALCQALEINADSHVVCPLEPTHDMGLLAGVVAPLLAGITVTWIDAAVARESPGLWLEAIARLGATHSGAADYLYRRAARRAAESIVDDDTLDLSRWHAAWLSAEPVRPETLDAFAEIFADAGFRREAFAPGYSLAEATTAVTWTRPGRELSIFNAAEVALEDGAAVPAVGGAARRLVSCGTAICDLEVTIVDPEDGVEPRPEGQIGEILVRGPSVAEGYWNRQRHTTRSFATRLDDDLESPFVRSGDLGFLHRGELYVTGRVKALLIIDGRPLHPADVESTTSRARAAVRPGGAVAFAVERDGAERLIVVAELENTELSPSLLDHEAREIADAVCAEHSVRPWSVAFVDAGALPRATPGRVARDTVCIAWGRDELEVRHRWRPSPPEGAALPIAALPVCGAWQGNVIDAAGARDALWRELAARAGLDADARVGGEEALIALPPDGTDAPADFAGWLAVETLSLAARRTDPPLVRRRALRSYFDDYRALMSTGQPLILQFHAWRAADRDNLPEHWLHAFHPEAAPPFVADVLEAAEPFFAVHWLTDAREDLRRSVREWSETSDEADAAAARALEQIDVGAVTLVRAVLMAVG